MILLPLELPMGFPDAASYDGMREIRHHIISRFDDNEKGLEIRWDIRTPSGQYTLTVNQDSNEVLQGSDPQSEERVTLRNMARQKLYSKAGVTSTKSTV